MNDWIIIDNMAIRDIAIMVKKGIKTTSPITLESKSTTGGKSKQYDLFKYFKNTSLLDSVKEKIFLNLDKHLQFKLSSLKLVSAWTVLGYKNSYHTLHKHGAHKNHVASVIYLNVPNSKHERDGGFFYVYKKDQEIDYGSHKPRVGDLVIFPVTLWHGAYPQSQGLRQTLNLDFEMC